MALLDGIVAGVARQFGLGDKTRALIGWLLSMMTSSRAGGLSGFLDHMRHAGLGSLVQDMMGAGEKAPLTSNQVESILGRNALSTIASKLGIGETLATSAIATALPNLIGALTPNGVVPDRLPAEVDSFMRDAGNVAGAAGRQVAAAGRQAVGAAHEAASTANTWMWSLLPLLGLGLLGVFLVRSCSPSATTTTTKNTVDTGRETVTVPDVTRLSDDLTGSFKSLKEILPDIKDASSAQAALPKLTDLKDKLDGMKTVMGKLSEAGKTRISDLIKSNLGTVEEQITKLMWIPGVNKIKPAVNSILSDLASLGSIPLPQGPRMSNEMADVFSSLTETLGGVQDKASAEAALPKLTDLRDKLAGAKASMDQLPAASKLTIGSLIRSAMLKLQDLTDKVLKIPGLGDNFKQVVSAIMGNLKALVG
jgi:uncharacterized protein YidB (DUF937 family)